VLLEPVTTIPSPFPPKSIVNLVLEGPKPRITVLLGNFIVLPKRKSPLPKFNMSPGESRFRNNCV